MYALLNLQLSTHERGSDEDAVDQQLRTAAAAPRNLRLTSNSCGRSVFPLSFELNSSIVERDRSRVLNITSLKLEYALIRHGRPNEHAIPDPLSKQRRRLFISTV